MQKEAFETEQVLLRKQVVPPESPKFTSERRRRKHYSFDKRIKDLPMK